ncbi:peptide chain release factor N(5)-glutamine methyltransferase [Moraxella oblonga]|uniref:peptide chain release factor N(5)-glutamine methyltransferase n=1 Tax=Moraxella oblonga TaxID=200413 RepID=UPI000A00BF19|nr:peptide chain release factor N(5)-glutamine methyltransferase [Moraxella oblonga]
MTIKQLKLYFRKIANDKLPHHWLESLLLFILNKDKIFLITHEEYTLTDDEYQKLQNGIAKMQQSVPLAYIIGTQHFFGHEFVVNEHTLIPRPDTEILVESVLNFIDDKKLSKGEILDLGTGSGCIAISLAKALANWQVVGVDNSLEALNIACLNAQNLQVKNCQFMKSNWFLSLTNKYQIIVSNPPYIDKQDKHLADLTHEPMTALVADNEGLSDIIHIVNHAPNYLYNKGLLVVEHGYNQGQAVQAIFKMAGFTDICTIKDYGVNDRITLGIYDE